MNNKKTLISVVVPCYNHQKYIAECINSIIDQDYENIELIIVDDGSKDESVVRIMELNDKCQKRFIKFIFISRENRGLCRTLNEALEMCSGEFISIIASDDAMLPGKISKQVNYLKYNESSIGVFGGFILKNEESETRIVKAKRKFGFKEIMLQKHYLPAPTQMLRLSKVNEVGGFDSKLIIEDWSMWLSLTKNGGTLDYLSDVFSIYRRHDDNLSNKIPLMEKGIDQILDLHKDFKEFKLAKAMSFIALANLVMKQNKLHAMNYLKKSISESKKIYFEANMYKALIKIILQYIRF